MLVLAKGLGIFLSLFGLVFLFGFTGKDLLFTLPVLVVVTVLLTIVFSMKETDLPDAKEGRGKPPHRAG